MKSVEFTRDQAEAAIYGRIRRSKLFTRLLTPLAVIGGVAAGAAGKSEDVAWAAIGTPIVAGGAIFAEGWSRERHLQSTVRRYSAALGVLYDASNVAVGDVSIDVDEGSVRMRRVRQGAELDMPDSRQDMIVIGGSLGAAAIAAGADEVVISHMQSGRLAPGVVLLAAGTVGMAMRNRALDQEPARYLQRLDNLEWAALNSIPDTPV